MRLLVCGSRNYNDYTTLERVLNEFHANYPITLLIEGGARGADSLAARWAFRHNVDKKTYPANWDKYGMAAGPIRNQQMIDEGKPNHVIAFPGGKGTADMIDRAMKANIGVTIVGE